MIATACVVCVTGCAAPGTPSDTSAPSRDRFIPADRPAMPARGSPSAADADRNLSVIDLIFDVAFVEFALDPQRHARKVWNHVDEMRVDPALAARLARNGVRAGAAGDDAWPALRTIFEACDTLVRRDQFAAPRNLPLVLRMDTIRDAETIFTSSAGGRFVGKTFPAGEKVLVIDYLYHPDLSGAVDLSIGFQVRHDRGELTWDTSDGVIRQVPAVDAHRFLEVDLPVTLYPGESLIVGLSEEARHEYLLGSRFLTGKRSGKPWETVLCIRPVPVRKEIARRRR